MTQTRKEPATPSPPLTRPELWKALCDPNRIAILGWLAKEGEPRTVSEVSGSGCCPVDLSVVSRHLATLREAGILAAARQGREVRYIVNAAPLVAALRGLADALESRCTRPVSNSQSKENA